MKYLFSCILALCFFSGTSQQNPVQLRLSQLQSSTLSLTGSTNVTCFECTFDPAYFKPVQHIRYEQQGDLVLLKDAGLELDLFGFDCGGKAINKDFREMLKADDFPFIGLNFTQILESEKGYEATVVISLAGRQQTYIVPVCYNRKQLRHARGSLKIKISDYQLQTPRKLFGLISVQDLINIQFDISAALTEKQDLED